MDGKEREFQKKLLLTFKVEAAEHIQALASGLVELENAKTGEERARIVEIVFRGAHSLKGAARAVGQTEIESICQSAEGVFSAMKRGALGPSRALFDVLHEAADALGKLLQGMEPGSGAPELRVAELVRRVDAVESGVKAPAAKPAAAPQAAREAAQRARAADEGKRPLAETVRISIAKLDALLLQAEELLSAKANASQRVLEVREILAELARQKKGRGRSAPAMKAIEGKLEALAKSVEHDRRSLFSMVDGLLEDAKKALMLPASSALDGLAKTVRDLSRDQGKEVELVVSGGEIEIDRRILDGLRDPLLHLIRNCADHGIEPPEARERAGKPRRGTLTLELAQKDGGKIEILVSDDGAGIDLGKVREAGRRLGLVPPGEGDEPEELATLVFQSGLSTSPIVTELSGRGLGLAIVRERVERLGGVVAVETRLGQGTAFRIVLPLALATFRGLHVRAGDQRFVLPMAGVEQCVRLKRETVETVENRETVSWKGQALALVRLADVLELARKPPDAEAGDTLHAAVLAQLGSRIAFEVDEVLGEQEILVKSLGRQLSRVRNVAGATVLGNGKAVPILNIGDLLQSAVKLSPRPRHADTAQAPERASGPQSILIAEDSITSRALLQNILESAGYRVAAAVDGVEALTLLKTERFDLVVSDVEMPRMDGFDLTAKIRADAGLTRLPVVLVTGLETREHRERGIEAGANAYLVKSSFDQTNLLETVRRLL